MRNMTRWMTVSVCTATLGAGLAFADHPNVANHANVANRQKQQQTRVV